LLCTNAKKKEEEYKGICLYSSLWAHNPSLTLKEEHEMRILENAVRGEIFWPKWEEVTDEGGKCVSGTSKFELLTRYRSGD
jgi:hypothetical protein